MSPLLPEGLGFGIGVGAMKWVVGLPFAVIGIVIQWRSILGRLVVGRRRQCPAPGPFTCRVNGVGLVSLPRGWKPGMVPGLP